MKITQLREKDGNLTLSTTDLDTFLQKIKGTDIHIYTGKS